jgi:hypothetical protein
MMNRTITPTDRTILRQLARQVAEAASDPVMQVRRQRWAAHNSLQSTRPMVLIFPEGAFDELLPFATMTCEGEFARQVEWDLRARLYKYHHFQDDSVLEAEWIEPPVIHDTGWGVSVQRHASTEARGAWAFEPVICTSADLKRLHFSELIYDEAQSKANLTQMQDLFGDILRVPAVGLKHIAFHLMSELTNWCGLRETMEDLAARPEFVHEVMGFLLEGHKNRIRQLVEANLFSLNNDNTYQSSGGNGYTSELPAPGFDPARVRMCDMWASAESQELAQVSPRMHREFALAYERQLLAPFGLLGYGCCEDLTRKLDDVCSLPNMRRISIAPSANVDLCAAKLQGKFIFSWKPQPAHLVGEFDLEAIRRYIRHTLEVARQNGCVLEMILKDTHTVEFHSERFDLWTQAARQEIRALGWED